MFKPRREVKEEDGSEGHEIQEDGSGPGQGREKDDYRATAKVKTANDKRLTNDDDMQ